MTDIDNNNSNKSSGRPGVERRSDDIGDDIVNQRSNKERRITDEDIDFDNRRKKQRRKPVIGVDIEERRKK